LVPEGVRNAIPNRPSFAPIPFVLYALVAVLAVAVTPVVRAIEDNVPPDVRRGIEDVLRKKAADLLSQKDKYGVSTKRGTYSKSFRKIDDSTYAATFTSTPSSRRPTTRRPTASIPSATS
jgi:hypothetical protein